MESIHSESELITAIEMTIGRPINSDDKIRLKSAIEWIDDPRRMYQIIDTIESADWWLSNGYSIANFEGGLGIYKDNGGGCYGYFSDEVVKAIKKRYENSPFKPSALQWV